MIQEFLMWLAKGNLVSATREVYRLCNKDTSSDCRIEWSYGNADGWGPLIDYGSNFPLLVYTIIMMQVFRDMFILSWNIHGAVNMLSTQNYRDLVNKFHLTFFVILETHAQFARMENFWRNLGSSPATVV